MTEADLAAADELRQLVGWNQTPQDWRRLLALEPRGCFVALRNQALAGTVTTTVYGTALAWIGMMLVHPEHRRIGLATRLMNRALNYLKERQVQCVKLDATPAGQPLYAQLGFVSEWTLQRWQRTVPDADYAQNVSGGPSPPLEERARESRPDIMPQKGCSAAHDPGTPLPASGERRLSNHLRGSAHSSPRTMDFEGSADEKALPRTRELKERDWPEVAAIDATEFGASRPDLLRRLVQDSRRALVWPAEGRVLGFGLLRPGAHSDYLGPVECVAPEGLAGLLPDLMRAAVCPSVTWDIPDHNEAAKAAAHELIFKPLRLLTRMRLGPSTDPPQSQGLFAIADPAVG